MEEIEEPLPPPLVPEIKGTPWGIWETIAFSVVIAVIFFGVSIVVFIGFVALDAVSGQQPDIDDLAADGLVFAASSLAASLVGALVVVGCAALRKRITVVEYLRLQRPRIRDLALWTVLLVVIFVPLEFVRTQWLGQPDVPESMLEVYRTCEFLPILWLAVVIGAPIGEEFFFRGFLFEGIRHSRLGPITAVVVCALVWAVIHFQYNAIDVSLIFLGGLFLGVARLKSGSLWVAVFLHFFWNLVSMIQTAYVVGETG